jgi:hypothetical protein
VTPIHNQDRQRFLDTLAEACGKTGWQVHAHCPTCGAVVFICAEVGTVFEIRGQQCGSAI